MFIEEGTSKVPIVRFSKAFSPRDLSEVLFIDDIGDKSGKILIHLIFKLHLQTIGCHS